MRASIVEAELGEVAEDGVDRADFVQLDDAEARALAAVVSSPLELRRLGAGGWAAWEVVMPTSTLSLPPASFSWAATNLSSSPRVVNHSSRPSM